MPYWKKNPQPVTYVCQLKPRAGLVVGGEQDGNGPVGGDNVVFWSVRFDIDENPEDMDADEPEEEAKEDISDDVD